MEEQQNQQLEFNNMVHGGQDNGEIQQQENHQQMENQFAFEQNLNNQSEAIEPQQTGSAYNQPYDGQSHQNTDNFSTIHQFNLENENSTIQHETHAQMEVESERHENGENLLHDNVTTEHTHIPSETKQNEYALPLHSKINLLPHSFISRGRESLKQSRNRKKKSFDGFETELDILSEDKKDHNIIKSAEEGPSELGISTQGLHNESLDLNVSLPQPRVLTAEQLEEQKARRQRNEKRRQKRTLLRQHLEALDAELRLVDESLILLRPPEEKKAPSKKKKTPTKKKEPIEKKVTPREEKKRVRTSSEGAGKSKMARCQQILNKLMKHPKADPFNAPVDPIAQGVPNYLEVIKDPMDFGTISKTLKARHYTSVEEFIEEVELVFSNCFKFNGEEADLSEWARELQTLFRHMCTGLEDEDEFQLEEPKKEVKKVKKEKPKKEEKPKKKEEKKKPKKKEKKPSKAANAPIIPLVPVPGVAPVEGTGMAMERVVVDLMTQVEQLKKQLEGMKHKDPSPAPSVKRKKREKEEKPPKEPKKPKKKKVEPPPPPPPPPEPEAKPMTFKVSPNKK